MAGFRDSVHNPPRAVQQSLCSPLDLYSFPMSKRFPGPHLPVLFLPYRMDLRDFSTKSLSISWLGAAEWWHTLMRLCWPGSPPGLTTQGQRLCVKYDSRKGETKKFGFYRKQIAFVSVTLELSHGPSRNGSSCSVSSLFPSPKELLSPRTGSTIPYFQGLRRVALILLFICWGLIFARP